jgi:N-acetylglucosaminyl-diphospho-decaprenol L-rhamnosyltransferase
MLDLSIIIISWNVQHFLAACLDSIRANTHGVRYEVIVVDSASSDGSVALLRDQYAWVTTLPQAENVGFTKGNNLGLRVAQGRYLLLLNPDTEIIGDALGEMVRYMEAHPDVGIVGPHTLNTDGSTQSSRRRFPTLLTGMFDATWLEPYAPRRLLDHYYARDLADGAVGDVDWVQGSALLTRRTIYEQIGGLDERYIMYSEELDWCKRIRMVGWRTVYLGTAHIVHHGGKSTEQVPAFKHIYFQQSKLRYFAKFHSSLVVAWLRVFLLLNYAHQAVIEAAKGALGHKRPLRRERVVLYWQVIRALLRG